MALRNVTLTGTTIGSGISNVSIYHSFVDSNNLIQAGVTSTQLANGYTFQDQDYRYTYYVVSDSACGTNIRVVLPNAPISTFTEGQIVDVSDNVITDNITGIVNSITNTQNDWMIQVSYGSAASDGYIVRSDDNGQTWLKEPTNNWCPDTAIAVVNSETTVHHAGAATSPSNTNFSYNGYVSFSSNGGNTWSHDPVMQYGNVNGPSTSSGFVKYSFQDVQSRVSVGSTKRDGHNKYVAFLGSLWKTPGAYQNNFTRLNGTEISVWLGGSATSGAFMTYDSYGQTDVGQILYGYGCRITDDGESKIFIGADSGEMLKITAGNVFNTVTSGNSGTNQRITAVGHNQEMLMTENGSLGAETTWLAAIEDANQASNTQEFIMSTDDGNNWVSYVGTNMDTDYIYDIKYIKGRWYAVGKKGTEGRICSTADLNDPWEQMGTTKPCLHIGVGRDIENTKIIIGCESGYIVQNQV